MVNQKYLKDENGNIFSPIVSESSVKGNLPVYFVRAWMCVKIK